MSKLLSANASCLLAMAIGAVVGLMLGTNSGSQSLHVVPTTTTTAQVMYPAVVNHNPTRRMPLKPLAVQSTISESATTTTIDLGSTAVLAAVGAGSVAFGALLAKLALPAADPAEEPLGGVSRRRFVAQTALAAGLPLLARPAQAEILPDDDDPEMIAAARANRKNKLAAERKLERETTEATTANTDPRYAALQSAVLRLAVIGRKLEEGNIDTTATSANAEISAADVSQAVENLSPNAAAEKAGAAFLAALKDLQAAVAAGAVPAARAAFIATVAELKAWCAKAGIEKQIVGL